MSILRYPEFCQICRGKLQGIAEMELEPDGDDYNLVIFQKKLRDWDICRRCRRFACHASCWDKQLRICKPCLLFGDEGNCPDCNQVLTGTVEIIKTEMFGIPIIRFRETSDRNWIQCQACHLVVCKECCRNARSGFCNECSAQINRAETGQPIAVQKKTIV